jgi:HAMP domain-containing protein
MLWLVNHLGLLDDRRARRYGCRCVCETPLGNGRVAWDLLTDERSRQAVIVAEQYCEGLATAAELEAAWGAARDVRGAVCAWAAAETASRPIRGAVAWSGAWAAAESAAWIAAETTSWAVQGSGAWDVVEAAQSVILRTLWTTDEIEITARAAIEKVKEWNA